VTFRQFLLQRLTAAAMVPLIVVHIVVIFIATRDGLSAAEILERTRGSVGWALFYGLFVVLAAAHGAIGVRNVLAEWTGLARSRLDIFMWVFGLSLFGLGMRAVVAVVGAS